MTSEDSSVLRIVDQDTENSVFLDRERGTLEFIGRFMPQKSKEFFDPIFDWIMQYSKAPQRKTVITFKMDYFNTSSSKKILDILLLLQDIGKKGQKVEVEWYHYADDPDIKEAGLGYADLVEIPFKFIAY
jgi:hypothetical protein